MGNLFVGAPNPSRLLIIAPDEFVEVLLPLMLHKNRTGMPSHMIKLSNIVGTQSDPASHPLAIKMAIVEGHQHHGVYYVMLVGDASKIPVRHRFVKQGDGGEIKGMDGTYNPTDHYYANLYNIGGAAAGVSDWDADKDGFYNLSTWTYNQALVDGSPRTNNPDKIDGYPHIAIGRVPAHTPTDVQNYVHKVIEYELGMRVRCIPAFTFICDQNLVGSPESCDSMIASSGIVSLPYAEVGKMWANIPKNTSPPPPWPSWDCFGSAASEQNALTAKWLVHVGHGDTNGWGITLDNGLIIDNSHIRDKDKSYSYPIILSAGCDTGAFLNWAPQHQYRGLNPDRSYWFWFYEDTKTVEEHIENKPQTWPTIIPKPHPYDFPNSSGRTFAYAWLCTNPAGGAIAYAGAMLVQQGAVYGGDLFMRVLRHAGAMAILGDAWVQGQRDYFNEHLHLDEILGNPRIYLGIQTLFGDPSLRLTPVIAYGMSAIMANDRLTVFARTAHGTLTNKFYDVPKSKWSVWTHLGDGQISSGPSAVMANGRLTVFARSAHGTLTHKFWDSVKQKWSKWIHLEGGEISSAPSAIMNGELLFVFARNLKGNLVNRFYDPAQQGWTAWSEIGDGEITSAPSTVMAGERLTVFAQRPNGQLGQKYYDTKAGRWTGWLPVVSGEITSAPSAVMAGQRLTVFALSAGGRLTHTFYDQTSNTWVTWKDLSNDTISSAPAAVMAGDRLTVFSRNVQGTLIHKFYDPEKQKWTDWIPLGVGQIT